MSMIRTEARELEAGANITQLRISFDPWVVVAFMLPVGKLVVFDFVGQLYLSDLLALGLLLFMVRAPDFTQRLALLRLFFGLLGLWLVALVATDLIRQSPPEDFLRGWAKIVFFGVHVAALWLFLPRRRAYFVSFALGSAIAWGLGVADQFEGYEWKFGYDRAAMFLLIGAICVASTRFALLRSLSPLFIAALAFFILFQNARSPFLIILLTAGLCGLVIVVERWPALQARIRAPIFAVLLLLGAGASALIASFYGTLAESGTLGIGAQRKYEIQTAGDVPLLLGGRSESIISLRAISDSPVIGHGSWAKDRRYVELYRALRLRMGMSVHDNYFQTRELIPTHSYLLGAWVEAGLLGGLFWLYVLFLPLLATYYLLGRNEQLLPLVAYVAAGLIWAIPFSPFGASERVLVAFQIVVLMWIITTARGRMPDADQLRWPGQVPATARR